MFKNFFNSSIRNLLKNKITSFINIFGVAIGVAGFLLILQYVVFERSFDAFHDNSDKIFRIQQDTYQNGTVSYQSATTYPAVGPLLKMNYPQVKDFLRMNHFSSVVTYDEKKFREDDIYYVDNSFFKIFSFPMIDGDANSALKEPNSVVLTEKNAAKYFGEENPIGKMIVVKMGNQAINMTVKGVCADVPSNSHFKFDFLVSYPTLYGIIGKEAESNWNQQYFYTYLLLDSPESGELLGSKMGQFIEKYRGTELKKINAKEVLNLQPLRSIHLNSDVSNEIGINGNNKFVLFLLLISVFILLISWINYVNISTARALERSKEVGVRKTIGATRKHLFIQFIFESAILNFIAIFIAVFIVWVGLPAFNTFSGSPQAFNYMTSLWFIFTIIGIWMVGTIVSGIYPAMILSGFKPISVLKGTGQQSVGGMSLRRILVVFQFSISVIMIAATLTAYWQLDYMKNKDLGIKIENTLVVRAPTVIPNDSLYVSNVNVFKNEALRIKGVKSFTGTAAVPGSETYSVSGQIKRVGGAVDEVNTYSLVWVDHDFIPSFQVKVLAGRNFSKEYGSDNQSIVLNEAAIQSLGFKSPQEAIGERIESYGQYQIVGVVQNFHQQSLKKAYVPMIFYLNNAGSAYYSLKVDGADTKMALGKVQEVYDNLFPGNPFEYFYLDEFFNEQYKSDRKFGQVFGFFTILAIVISCLGLFGLSYFTIAQRSKEMSIRKVLGANSSTILYLIFKEFFKLLLIANLISIPIAYFGADSWLKNYTFRINVGWWLFILPVVIIAVITAITISYQTMKVAFSKPIKFLRNE